MGINSLSAFLPPSLSSFHPLQSGLKKVLLEVLLPVQSLFYGSWVEFLLQFTGLRCLLCNCRYMLLEEMNYGRSGHCGSVSSLPLPLACALRACKVGPTDAIFMNDGLLLGLANFLARWKT